MTKKEQQKLLHKIEVNTFQSVMSEDADWIKDEVFQHFREVYLEAEENLQEYILAPLSGNAKLYP